MKYYKIILCITFLSFILSLNSNLNAQEIDEVGTRTIVENTHDEISKLNAKYAPNYSSYCSATLITPNVGLTSRHCVGKNKQEGYIGAIYPAQSGLNTPYGYMNVSSYIPDSSRDIAILKGTENDKSSMYKYYMKNIETGILSLNREDLKKLTGEKIYSFGYPYDFVGSPLVKAEGVIKSSNIPNGTIDTTMPVSDGQSGAGVFLAKNNKLIGVLSGGYNSRWGNLGRVTYIDDRLEKLIINNKN